MSREVPINGVLTHNSPIGPPPYTIFAWIHVADLLQNNTLELMSSDNFGGWDRAFNSINNTTMNRELTGAGTSTWVPADPTSEDGVWCGYMFTIGASNDCVFYWHDYTPKTVTFAQTDNNFWRLQFGEGAGNTRAIQVAEVCIWDKKLSGANFTTLIDVSGGNAVNPTTIESANVVHYSSFKTDTLTPDYGDTAKNIEWDDDYTETGVTSYSALHPLVDSYGTTIQQSSMNYLMNMMRG